MDNGQAHPRDRFWPMQWLVLLLRLRQSARSPDHWTTEPPCS